MDLPIAMMMIKMRIELIMMIITLVIENTKRICKIF